MIQDVYTLILPYTCQYSRHLHQKGSLFDTTFMLGPSQSRGSSRCGALDISALRQPAPAPQHSSPALLTMRWPWSGHDNDKKTSLSAWIDSFKSADWLSAFTDPRTVGPSVVLTASTVAALRFYKSYLRRVPSVNHIKPEYFRRRSLFGKVTSVGDADNFRLFHTPGGRIAGWEWLPWKRVPAKKEGLAKNTVRFPDASTLLLLTFCSDTYTACWH